MSHSSKNIEKNIASSFSALEKSSRTLEDIYNINFSRDGVLAETSDSNGIRTYTYEFARSTIDTLAAAIIKETSSSGRFVALYADNCAEYMFLFWAILKSGNKPYLVNMRQPSWFIASIMRTLNVEYVICKDKSVDFGKKNLDYDELLRLGAALDRSIDAKFENEFALTTNGTTLQEKICIYSGREVSAQVLNAHQIIGWNADIKACYRGNLKMFMVLPLYHVFGLEAAYLWFLFFGAIFVFPASMVPEVLMETARRHKVTHIFSVPLFWNSIEKSINRQLETGGEKLRKKFETARDLSIVFQNVSPALGQKIASILFKDVRKKLLGDSVRFCISGGSHIKRPTIETITALGYPLYNGYGMTEIGIASADFAKRPRQRVDPTIGPNFSSVRFAVNEDGRLLVQGESVCKKIIVNGTVMPSEEWFDTGDIVVMGERGKYHICGRASDLVINENGENINPDLAEKVFDLADALCFSVIGDPRNENLWLIIQVKEDITAEQKERLLADISKGMNALPLSYRIQKILYTTDPLMGGGDIKVSRTKLKAEIKAGRIHFFDPFDGGMSQSEADSASDIKAKLRGLFSFILGLPEQAITDDAHFLNDLDGSSLDYFTLLAEIEKTFGVKLSFESDDFSYSLSDFEKIIKEALQKDDI